MAPGGGYFGGAGGATTMYPCLTLHRFLTHPQSQKLELQLYYKHTGYVLERTWKAYESVRNILLLFILLTSG